MKNLEKILENLPSYQLSASIADLEVMGIAYDSRRVKSGYVFVCIKGFHLDGHDFIDQALEKGAQIIIIQHDVPEKKGIIYIKVPDSRAALSKLSDAFYGYPTKEMNLVGVTGTNGKTTTTYMVEAILRHARLETGLIGTIRNKIGDLVIPTERTTPESSDLYELFAQMCKAKVTHTVMEVSSHALELRRVMDLRYKVGIFTNITQDHLDFHESIEAYTVAKGKLFKHLTPDGVGVINHDDPASQYMIDQCDSKVLTYGIKKDADIKASEIKVTMSGVSYNVTTPVGEMSLKLKFTGYFNVYNSLAAIGAGLALNIPLEVIREGLESISGVSGRFEQVECGQNFGVIVDYAHTPDGMENVLRTAKEIVNGRKIVVFGCGGDRDRGKRPLMGRIAAEYCDLCILTSDNPRTEDPMRILQDIEQGLIDLKQPVNYLIIADRKEAIFRAIKEAKSDDLVIILGKGHETYQTFKDHTISFDDREVAREAIKSL